MNKKTELKALQIKGNRNSPDVNFDPNGKLEIAGRSVLENTITFFQPIIKWVDEYCKEPSEKTEFHLKMDYFNTSSSKFILSIFESLQKLYKSDKKVKVIWCYSDDDSLEFGKDYSFLLDMPFEFIRKE